MVGASILGIQDISGLSLIPLRIKQEQYWQPRCIGYYSFTTINTKYLTISAFSTIQYCRALDRILKEVVLLDPALVPVYFLKSDVSNGFYRIILRAEYTSNLGLVFYSGVNKDDLVTILFTTLMGWNNSPIYYAHPCRRLQTCLTQICSSIIPQNPTRWKVSQRQ